MLCADKLCKLVLEFCHCGTERIVSAVNQSTDVAEDAVGMWLELLLQIVKWYLHSPSSFIRSMLLVCCPCHRFCLIESTASAMSKREVKPSSVRIRSELIV